MKISYYSLCSIGFIFGILNWLFIIPISLLIFIYSKNNFKLLLFFAISFFLALFYASYWNEMITNDVSSLQGTQSISGEILEITSRRIERSTFILGVDSGNTKTLVNYYSPSGELEVGDRIQISGSVRSIEDVDEGYRNYLESRNIHTQVVAREIEVMNTNKLRNVFYRINLYITKELEKNLDFEVANFNEGLLIGKDPVLSQNLSDNVKNLGLSHILSASGFNIGLIYILLDTTLRFDIKKKRILIILFAWIYTFIIGLESVGTLRATLMLTYVLLALNSGRKTYFSNSILFSAIIILIIYPYYYSNVSFQLSLAATIGIFYVSKPIKNILEKIFENRILSESISLTLAAIISTYPIVIYHFDNSQPGNLLANLLVLPLVPILTVYSAILVLISSLNLDFISTILSISISGLTEFTFMLLNKISSFGLVNSTITLILAMFIFKYANRTYKNFSADIVD